MSDLISRRKAFEYFVTLWECIGTIMDRDEWEDVCMTTANEIPSAQLESAKRTAEAAQNVSDSDLISRKAAIDAFDGVKVDEENCTEYDIGYNDGIDFAVSRLSVLPSAQPKQQWISCSDCKKRGKEQADEIRKRWR